MEISGQMALVSGGGSGLGAATARHLANLGAKVAILDFDSTRAQAVAEKSAYAISDMISRETQPITPTYMTNARNIYKDLSGLSPGETALRVTLLRWDGSNNVFKVDLIFFNYITVSCYDSFYLL